MKFLCLCYYDAARYAAWTPEDHAAIGALCAPHDQALRATGKMKTVGSLPGPDEAVCIYPRDAGPEAKAGAFVRTGEPLGAFFMLEAADLAEAQKLAAMHPGANLGKYFGGGIEIRAVDHFEQI